MKRYIKSNVLKRIFLCVVSMNSANNNGNDNNKGDDGEDAMVVCKYIYDDGDLPQVQ